MESWINKLVEMGVCSDAVAWAKQYPTAKAAWKACDRPDWMLWVASLLATSQFISPKFHADRSAIVLAAAACARTALVYVPAMEGRPLAAIEAAERWARESNEQNRAAAEAAAGAARVAARVAEAAAWAAEAAAGVARAAAWAAEAAAWAAWAAARVAARAAARAATEAAAGIAARVAAEAAAGVARAAARAAPEAAARVAARVAANREMVSIIRNFIGIKFLKGRYGLLIKKPSSKGKIKKRLQ